MRGEKLKGSRQSNGSLSRFRRATLLCIALSSILLLVSASQPIHPTLHVDVDASLSTINQFLLAANHRYHDCGAAAWDCDLRVPISGVLVAAREIGVTILRFPGGSVGSPYHFVDGIGPVNKRPASISGFTGVPESNDYGFDEHMILVEELGVKTTVVVNFGSGTAQEAAAWVAYSNGDINDDRPIGVDRFGHDWGTIGEWAARRNANQVALGRTPHPYSVRYWEVGNELYGDWEYAWTHDPVRYALGGTEPHENEPVGRAGSWQDDAARSDGTPDQSFVVRYPPIFPNSFSLTVNGNLWRSTNDLSAHGPRDPVYTVDTVSGEIRFGNGMHGFVPPKGAEIRTSYASGPHDGFVDFATAMKAVDPSIAVGSCFNDETFLRTIGDIHPLDFVVLHLYSGPSGRDPDLVAVHLEGMAIPFLQELSLNELEESIGRYLGSRSDEVEILVSEYHPYFQIRDRRYVTFPHSLSAALAVTDMLRIFAEHEVPVAMIHPFTNTRGGALIGPPPDFTRKATSYAIELFGKLGPLRVVCTTDGVPTYARSYRSDKYRIPYIEILASVDSDRDRLTLLVINKHPTDDLKVEIEINGFRPDPEGSATVLTARTLNSYNTPRASEGGGPDLRPYLQGREPFHIHLPRAFRNLVGA